MNNEIERKITSLTLMTIMVAGGMTFAIPGMMPAAYAQSNANLFVSAENSQFDNYMVGSQVIEVVVIDPDIDDTDEGKGEPDVDVNSKKIRMTQAVDGNWYGYFSDRKQAEIADNTNIDNALFSPGGVQGLSIAGAGLDFGLFCDKNTKMEGTANAVLLTFTETVGIAINEFDATTGGTNSTVPALDTCGTLATDGGGGNSTTNNGNNMVREAKSVNDNGAIPAEGQINMDATYWPVIQLYDLNPTGSVIIKYNKGGGTQSVTLTFDTVDQFAGLELDRSKYTTSSQVHATVTDVQLNMDPTDEDSWTFATNTTGQAGAGKNPLGLQTIYQLFDENGLQTNGAASVGFQVDQPGGATDLNRGATLPNLQFEDNGILILNANQQGAASDIVNLQDNDDQVLIAGATTADATTGGLALGANTQPVTLVERFSSNGIFANYDDSDIANIITTDDITNRGQSASIDYNETPQSIVLGFEYATLDIQPVDDEWNSGEEIPFILVDADANKNSRIDEDLDVFNPAVDLIPALATGNPFTLSDADTNRVGFFTGVASTAVGGTLTSTGVVNATTDVEEFSFRGQVTPDATNSTWANADGDGLIIDYRDANFEDLSVTAVDTRTSTLGEAGHQFHAFNYYNYDLRSVYFNSTQTFTSLQVYLLNGSDIITDAGTIGDPKIIADLTATGAGLPGVQGSLQGLFSINATYPYTTVFGAAQGTPDAASKVVQASTPGVFINFTSTTTTVTFDNSIKPIISDFFSFGFAQAGVLSQERFANQVIRIEAEETGDNTSTFEGSLEYRMMNQLNILDQDTYDSLSPIADDPTFIVIEDLTDEDSPRVNYFDLDLSGVPTTSSDQEEAPSHSGVVSFDLSSYKVGDTVFITIEDVDLNVDSDLIEIYTVVDPNVFCTPAGATCDSASEAVGEAGLPKFIFDPLGELLDITYDDEKWADSNADFDNDGVVDCTVAEGAPATADDGLFDTDFTMVETGPATGIFSGDFLVPDTYCSRNNNAVISVTGKDIEVNYLDFRDASGEIIEVGDSAGIRANTGSVSLDRTVYPVPWGEIEDIGDGTAATQTTGTSDSNGFSIFPIHATGIALNFDDTPTTNVDAKEDTLRNGDLIIHVRVNDPDFDISPVGEDVIGLPGAAIPGPVKIAIARGSDVLLLATAGAGSSALGVITTGFDGVNTVPVDSNTDTRELGPIVEISPDAGIFELDFVIRYTDGPLSTTCPSTDLYVATNGTIGRNADPNARFDIDPADFPNLTTGNYCLLQGDIITVEYTDPTDASGSITTVTDSASFDLRNGVLQSDKSVYIIGADMIMTIIDPDWDLDNDSAETYDLDIIEWDSDAATVSMGSQGGEEIAFDPEPSNFRETGDSTGIFQIVIEIPEELQNDRLERGEEVVLEYTDWGPSGSDFVGDEDEDINLTIFTSNFGATVELDQKVYTWTDKVYITIVAPDHNFDSDLIDEIGESNLDPIKVATRGKDLDQYKLVETGTDTGIFTGEVILTGFPHDADGKSETGDKVGFIGSDTNPRTEGEGPTSGFLESSDDDGITVSFEFSEDETVVGSSLIRWNIGETQWLEASYPASGTGVVRVVDPDVNLNPESVDNFDVDVWSDSDAGGIDLTVTETNEATGIFEGTVFFTTTDESSGHRLRVAEGDTITAEYEDNTLPDPYTRADELDITGTAIIGTIVPPLERAPAANARVVDAFGNSLAEVQVDQQVQITADLANGQDREQSFAYLVQIQDGNGVTVSLAWITGSLAPGQSFSPALSWIPTAPGTYTATVFVWQDVNNPTALSPPVSVNIRVV